MDHKALRSFYASAEIDPTVRDFFQVVKRSGAKAVSHKFYLELLKEARHSLGSKLVVTAIKQSEAEIEAAMEAWINDQIKRYRASGVKDTYTFTGERDLSSRLTEIIQSKLSGVSNLIIPEKTLAYAINNLVAQARDTVIGEMLNALRKEASG